MVDTGRERITRDFKVSEDDPIPGILFQLATSSNLLHWKAQIEGPPQTPYEGGRFHLDIRFPENYPLSPPKILFETKIFHPNISSTGEICLDILSDKWSTVWKLHTILLAIQSLLGSPYLQNPLVPDAAYLYTENRDKYNRIARDWTLKYTNTTSNVKLTIRPWNQTVIEAETSMKLHWKATMWVRTVRFDIKSINIKKLPKLYPYLRSLILTNSLSMVVDKGQDEFLANGESKRRPNILQNCLEYKRPVDYIYYCAYENPKNEKNESHDPLFERIISKVDKIFSRSTEEDDQCLKMYREYLTASDKEDLPVFPVVDVAILGILKEGKKQRQMTEAIKITDELKKVRNENLITVSTRCVHLYTKDSFLFRTINKCLRDEDYLIIETLGPFIYLLYSYYEKYPLSSSSDNNKCEETFLYRGVNLSEEQIEIYKRNIGFGTYRWYGFSSTSKNRDLAEFFDTNTLFIMRLYNLKIGYRIIDISWLSQFPEEQEVLLVSGTQFTIEDVEYVTEKKKYYIYLRIYV